jgi:pimeloyl-ACP methyl ester carboxylesterase
MMRERPDAMSLLPTITVPTIVIGATHDPIIPADESRAMADQIPHGQAVIIDEVGHLSNLERPDVFNAAIINWMQRNV